MLVSLFYSNTFWMYDMVWIWNYQCKIQLENLYEKKFVLATFGRLIFGIFNYRFDYGCQIRLSHFEHLYNGIQNEFGSSESEPLSILTIHVFQMEVFSEDLVDSSDWAVFIVLTNTFTRYCRNLRCSISMTQVDWLWLVLPSFQSNIR